MSEHEARGRCGTVAVPRLPRPAPSIAVSPVPRSSSSSAATTSHVPGPFLVPRTEASADRDVPLQPCDFVLVDVFPDLPPELLDVPVGPVLLELVAHLRADAGDEDDLFRLRRVQVDRLPEPLVDPAACIGAADVGGE